MINRRDFIKYLTLTSSVALLPGCVKRMDFSVQKNAAHIVVVGGGAGGATAAKYLKLKQPSLKVTLLEPKSYYHTCFMSNSVIADLRPLSSIRFSYQGLKALGIEVICDSAQDIISNKKIMTTRQEHRLNYDKLIVSPGIALNWSSIAGYSPEVANQLPHAWQAGQQTALLKQQVKQMRSGGLMVISIPPKPFRCPPGPYERASLIANYFKQYNPRAKILLLDANDSFTKQDLFIQGWEKLYGFGTDNSMIEWRPQKDDGRVIRVDAKTKMVFTELDAIQADVINLIPGQTASGFALDNDLTDGSGWCPIRANNFASKNISDVYVIGDASIAAPMPKSAFAANSQAKVVVDSILAELNAKPAPTPYLLNTCYSLLAEDYGISVTASYQFKNHELASIAKTKGTSSLSALTSTRALEAQYTRAWYQAITRDIFG